MSNKIDVEDNEKEKENENDYDNEKLLNKLTIETKKPKINIYFFSKTIFILFNFFIIFYKKSTELKEQNIQKIPAKENIFNKNYTIENITNIDNSSFNKQKKIPKLNNNKTIVSIFAGRKRYLKLLLKYLMNLKNNNKIHEIHFWQFTNNKEDLDYISSIANIHKTTGVFKDFQSIYPVIENNEFQISIKQEKEKGGAVILINDKYEITFQFIDNSFMEITIKKEDKIYSVLQENKYYSKEFSVYNIKILNKELIITGKNNLYIKTKIEDNNINSVKIHSTENSLTVWDYKEKKNEGLKIFDSAYRACEHWYESYKFYLDYDFDIFIKVDDDITFIDINRFDEFIDYINLFKKNITLPNLVNQAVSVYFNNKYGLLPNNILDKKYLNKRSPLNIFNYYKDGKQSVKIHEYFLDNVDKFINNDMKPEQLNGQKPSICMFGMTKESFNNVYSPQAIWKRSSEPNNVRFLDEPYTYGLLNNYIYPRFVCAHYAFGSQRRSGLSESYLERYENLANKFLNNIA